MKIIFQSPSLSLQKLQDDNYRVTSLNGLDATFTTTQSSVTTVDSQWVFYIDIDYTGSPPDPRISSGFDFPGAEISREKIGNKYRFTGTMPIVGGISTYEDPVIISLYYTTSAYEIRCQFDVKIEGSHCTVTPTTSRIGLEGGTQLITVTSDYPLTDYNQVTGSYGEATNIKRPSDNEIQITYTLPESEGDNRYDQPILTSDNTNLKPIPLTNIYQGLYLEANTGGVTTVSAASGMFIVDIQSNVDWTINADSCLVGYNTEEQVWVNSLSGSGDDAIFIKYNEWFTNSGTRPLKVTITSELGEKVITVTQVNEVPWITFSSPTKTISHTGGSITFDNYAATTNCKDVTLSVSDGTVTPTNHTGKWGETTSMDLIWEIPSSESERTLTITGTAEASDGTSVTGSFNVKQLSPYTFSVDISSFRSISVDGGPYTMEYTTDAPSVELSLTKAKEFITDFSYTQPVNGVGTFTLTYADAHYTNGRTSTPTVVAIYDGVQIGSIRLDDYQLGTGFWLPDIEQTISHLEQVVEVTVHNISCDLKESNLSLHQTIPGLSMVSYTPATSESSGILYVRVPFNNGPERSFLIKVDALDNNGNVFSTDTGVKITQLEIPPIIYVDWTFDAAFHREELEHSLVGDWWVLSKVSWIQSETSDGTDPSSIFIRIEGNPTKNTRVGYVYIYGETQTYILKVTQTAIDFSFDPDGDLIPICEEITYSENTDKTEYHIEVDGKIVYAGYVYRYPDEEENVKIELNDILSDYLENHISFTEGLNEMKGFYKTFKIVTPNASEEIQVYNSWEKPLWPLLNDPISNEIDPRQYLFINYIDGYGEMSVYKNGSEIDGLGTVAGGVYVVPRNEAVCNDEVWYDIRHNYTDVVAVQKYVYKGTNKNYALYYINAYGGWDSLAIRGNVTQTDKMQSQTYKNKTNGKVKYLNTITPTWQLYTDDMNDGSKMHHLLESTEVYLHNLETDEIVPVVITDSNCVYKTYANQGNTRFHYTINVEASNYKIRK